MLATRLPDLNEQDIFAFLSINLTIYDFPFLFFFSSILFIIQYRAMISCIIYICTIKRSYRTFINASVHIINFVVRILHVRLITSARNVIN